MPEAELGSTWPDLKRLRALTLELFWMGTSTTSSKAGVEGTTILWFFLSSRSSRRFCICWRCSSVFSYCICSYYCAAPAGRLSLLIFILIFFPSWLLTVLFELSINWRRLALIDYFCSDMDGSRGSIRCGEATSYVKDFFCADVIPFFIVISIILEVVCCWIKALFRFLFFRTCCWGMTKLWVLARWLLPKSDGRIYC